MNDKKYPQNADRQPKRRKAKDNPYTIFTVGRGTEDTHYFVRFKDVHNQTVTLEVTKAQYEVFEESELTELSQMNEYDRHIEHHNLSEKEIEQRLIRRQTTIEERMLERLEDEFPFSLLSETQCRRFLLHYAKGFTYKQIAEMEGCIVQAVAKSVKQAKQIIMKYL